MSITIHPSSAHEDLFFLKINGTAVTMTGVELITLCEFVTDYISADASLAERHKKTKAA